MKEIEFFKQKEFNEIYSDTDLRQRFVSLYKKIYNEDVCRNCKSDLKNKFNNLKQINIEKLQLMAERKFILKASTVLQGVQSLGGIDLSPANITDELAVKLLQANSKYSIYFEKLPEGWEKLVGKEEEIKTTVQNTFDISVEGMSVSELKSYAKEKEIELPKNLTSKKKIAEYILKAL